MTYRAWLCAGTAGFLLMAGAGAPLAAQDRQTRDDGGWSDHVAGWPAASRTVVDSVVNKYGPPTGMTPNMLTWGNSGPWKRIVLLREPVHHEFPMPHEDVLAQTIDYKVPVERIDDLAQFDGSLIVDRTAGELTARCDSEAANYIALNLAHEIITGKLSVEDARNKFREQAGMLKDNKPAPYAERFMFPVQTDTKDPGKQLGG